MTNKDIRLLNDYLHDEQVDTKELDKITKKLELIVKQIEAQETYNDTMDQLHSELDKLK